MMDAFEDIYGEYFPRVYVFLYRMCRSADLAEELTQETFYEAFKSFRRFRGESELFTWLASIAKHVYFSHLRKNKRGELVELELLTDTLSDGGADPSIGIQHEETVKSVRRAIKKMPQKYKDVVVLRIYAELPFSEIADSLGITENSAKVIFHRAKKMLTEELENEYFV